MKFMNKGEFMKKNIFMMTIALGIASFTVPVVAQDTTMPHDMSSMSMSVEDREKMAVSHQNMATCLRSDVTFKICHDALKNDCQNMMGTSCSGMDMGKSMRKGTKPKK